MNGEPVKNVGTSVVIADHLAAVDSMDIVIAIVIVLTWRIPRHLVVRAYTVIMARRHPARSGIVIDRRPPGVR